MPAVAAVPPPVPERKKLEKKPIKFSNLLLGAGLNMFEVTTLGQPLEVIKTTMAAHRGDGFMTALSRIWSRGGMFGCMCPLRPFMDQSLWRATDDARENSLPGPYPLGLD